MIHNRFVCTCLLAGSLALIGPAFSQNTGATQPDNTKVNKRDRGGTTSTADSQKNNLSDRELTQQIRKALMADKSLSTYAHNVKIISQNGTVTLKGPVRSEEEKKTIVAKAADIAGGASKITDDLSVKP
jgi:hyperosmotically inducible protein